MNFKKMFLSGCLVVFMANALACNHCEQKRFYIGVDQQLRYMPFDKDFGQVVMRKRHQQNNMYVGFRFNNVWGMEAGHESTVNRKMKTVVLEGQSVNGSPITAGLSPAYFTTTMQARGPHADIVFNKSFSDSSPLSFCASYGVSLITIKVKRDNTAFGAQGHKGPFRKMQKSYPALRAMVGLQYSFGDSFSLRASVSALSTGRKELKSKNTTNLPISNRPLTRPKDSCIFGIGGLLYF